MRSNKLDKLEDWVKNTYDTIDILEMVQNTYVECFGEEIGLAEFSEYTQAVNKHIELVKSKESKLTSDDEIKIEMIIYVILEAWHQAAFVRQQGALYAQLDDDEMDEMEVDAKALFNLEYELCRRYPSLRKAFNILDGEEDTHTSPVLTNDDVEELDVPDDELPF